MFQLQNRYGRLNEYFLALYILGLKASECVVPRAGATVCQGRKMFRGDTRGGCYGKLHSHIFYGPELIADFLCDCAG